MSRLSLAILEKRSRWVPELKRRFLGTPITVRGYSTARELAGGDYIGVALLVLDDLEEACLDLLFRLGRRMLPPCMVVVGSKQNADLEWSIRELGATAFVMTDIPSDEMVDLCRRLLKQA